MNQQQLAVDMLPCPYCGAARREWCRTRPSGNRATLVHADRFEPVHITYWMAYEEATNEVLDSIIDGQSWVDTLLDRRRRQRMSEPAA